MEDVCPQPTNPLPHGTSKRVNKLCCPLQILLLESVTRVAIYLQQSPLAKSISSLL